MGRKKLMTMLKLQIPAGQASPAPPVGPALGQHGVNIMDFVKAYNDATSGQAGTIVPVEISIYDSCDGSHAHEEGPLGIGLSQDT